MQLNASAARRPWSIAAPLAAALALLALLALAQSASDDVDYKVFPGVGHGEIPAAAETDALAFFERRLPSGR